MDKNSVEKRRKARKPINDYATSHLQFFIDVLISHVPNSASSGTFAFRLRPLADQAYEFMSNRKVLRKLHYRDRKIFVYTFKKTSVTI